ncbi:MAG: hypothetical protein PUF37_00975 [Prevotellaceae bacterium]|nr:hypothetical protein [Prevotellaceae bacterium]
MKRIVTKLILAFLTLCSATPMLAQPATDELTVEAMMDYHRKTGLAHRTRRDMEICNELAHAKEADTNGEYEETAKELDKYGGIANWMSFILKSAATGYHAYIAASNTADNISGTVELLRAFSEKVYKEKKVYATDTVVLNSAKRCCSYIKDDIKSIKKDMKSITGMMAAQSLGAASFPISKLLTSLDNLNTDLSDIDNSVRNLRGTLLAYMTVRGSVMGAYITAPPDLQKIYQAAYDRWMGSAMDVFSHLGQSVEHKPLGHGALIGHEG